MEIRKLAAPVRPREYCRYQVSGLYPFPVDMLRYDSAWPADSDAVDAITLKRPGERVAIQLASHRQPTSERWESFGWKVC